MSIIYAAKMPYLLVSPQNESHPASLGANGANTPVSRFDAHAITCKTPEY